MSSKYSSAVDMLTTLQVRSSPSARAGKAKRSPVWLKTYCACQKKYGGLNPCSVSTNAILYKLDQASRPRRPARLSMDRHVTW
jgi:hypothetical protein